MRTRNVDDFTVWRWLCLYAFLCLWFSAIHSTVIVAFAPAPLVKPVVVPTFAITSGEWTLRWGTGTERMPLGADGSYQWGASWEGTWSWDSASKTFAVREWVRGGEKIHEWHVVLDINGEGITVAGSFPATAVKVKLATIELLPLPKVSD